MANKIKIPKDTPDWQQLVADTRNARTDAENLAHQLSGDVVLQDGTDTGLPSAKVLRDEAENHARATSSFTDDDGISYPSGALGYAQDAKSHAQATSSFTDVNGTTFSKGARGYAQDAEQAAKDIGSIGAVDGIVQSESDLPSSTGSGNIYYVLDTLSYYEDTGSGAVQGGWKVLKTLLNLGDNDPLYFGTDDDYWFVFDGALKLRAADFDGSGNQGTLFGTRLAGSGGKTVLDYTPSGQREQFLMWSSAENMPFELTITDGDINTVSRHDNTLRLGYNTLQQNTAKHTCYWAMEQYYTPSSGTYWLENYIQYELEDGTRQRNYFEETDLDEWDPANNKGIRLRIRANDFAFRAPDGQGGDEVVIGYRGPDWGGGPARINLLPNKTGEIRCGNGPTFFTVPPGSGKNTTQFLSFNYDSNNDTNIVFWGESWRKHKFGFNDAVIVGNTQRKTITAQDNVRVLFNNTGADVANFGNNAILRLLNTGDTTNTQWDIKIIESSGDVIILGGKGTTKRAVSWDEGVSDWMLNLVSSANLSGRTNGIGGLAISKQYPAYCFEMPGDTFAEIGVRDAADETPSGAEQDNHTMIFYTSESNNELRVQVRYGNGTRKVGTITLS